MIAAVSRLPSRWTFTPLNGKRPLLAGWQVRPRATDREIHDWGEEGRNLGLRTGTISGVVVVDVDCAKGGEIPPDLPDTVTVQTGGGGLHYYFAYEDPLGNSSGRLAPHVDVKADDGQVVFPGSIHPDTGKLYDWMPGHAPWEIGLAPLPQWIVEKLSRSADDGDGARSKLDLALVLQGVPDGERNDQLFRYACSLRNRVAKDEAVILVDQAMRSCAPAYREETAQSLVHRVWASYEASKPAFGQPAVPDPVPLERSVPIQFPASDRGWGDLMAWREPRPKALIGDGLLRARQIGMIHGRDGSRKSWVMLHLALCAAAGRPFFGLEIEEPLRVGLISLEDDYWTLHDRASSITAREDLDHAKLTENLRLVAPPVFDLPIDILDPAQARVLRDWTLQHHLDLLLVDHLTRFHSLDDEKELGRVSAAMIQLARDCTVGLLTNHHDRKAAAGARGKDAQAARGDSRFVADCRFVAHVIEAGDRIRFEVEKSTGTRKPDVIWLRHCDAFNGALEVTTAPKAAAEKKQGNLDALVAIVEAAGPAGIAPGAINAKQSLGVCAATMRRYASQLEAQGVLLRDGKTDSVRWISPRPLRALESASGECAKYA